MRNSKLLLPLANRPNVLLKGETALCTGPNEQIIKALTACIDTNEQTCREFLRDPKGRGPVRFYLLLMKARMIVARHTVAGREQTKIAFSNAKMNTQKRRHF